YRLFRESYLNGVLTILVLFIFIFFLAKWSKNHYFKKDAETYSKFTRFGKLLIDSPFYTVLFLTSLSIRLIFPELPQMIRVINLLLLMISVIYFLIHMYYRYVKSLIYTLLIIFIFSFVYEFIFYPDIILRIVLLGFSVSGLIFFYIVFKNKPLEKAIKNKLVYGIWRLTIFLFILFELTGIAGNFIGAFSMAEFFTYAPIHTLILGITVFITTKLAETLIPIILKIDILQELNVIREDFDSINKKAIRLIKFLMWGLFVVLALRFFRIQEPIYEWGNNLLNNGWEIGAVVISLKSVIIFIFIIWLSIILSRIITQILEKDVFERIKVSRGVPATVTMVLKIIFIAGGFLLAAAAAGMELTNLSIILGAFSVGIGFGLQNIFNNLVSGLIIAFERPIKVGDTVQIDQLMGTVKKIGLRSSTVKSFDGAEVIVPNGNIISNQMINWTLSDFSRRMDIRVGVAYGTDPEKVLEIMMNIAEEHEKVYKIPKPHAFFIGFGDSSLNFRLLAWSNIENRLEAESQIHIQINKKLAEAGIEIPFPQRDLHIRSDDTIKKTTTPSKTTKSTRRKNADNK
ncbi:MAG: mechanosensitive ion channel family protein, partial [Bacteroidales bacterium]